MRPVLLGQSIKLEYSHSYKLNSLMPYQCEVPVVLFLFNRPAETERLLKQIALVRPTNLLVVCDGPRTNHPTDSSRCAEVKSLIERGITWPTTLITNYADKNLGCKVRVASGIDWIFENFDRAIILEDDCIPDPTFFQYCEALLEYYKDHQDMGMISGDNFLPSGLSVDHSYYFSRYTHIWGWATWKRAWKQYDIGMTSWPTLRDSGWLESLFSHPLEAQYWKETFERTYNGTVNTWDYQWLFASWVAGLLTILPKRNLVSNIGFGPSATHTEGFDPNAHALACLPMGFPLVHPPTKERNVAFDDWSQQHIFGRAKDRSLKGRFFRVGTKVANLFKHS